MTVTLTIPAKKAIPTEGEILHIHGYQFEARNVRVADGMVRFEGHATATAGNATIQKGQFNGATYGWAL